MRRGCSTSSWAGVGHCDGSDVGGEPPAGPGSDGTVLNFFCPVVDVPIGVAALRRVARQLKLSQRWVIGARDPGDETGVPPRLPRAT